MGKDVRVVGMVVGGGLEDGGGKEGCVFVFFRGGGFVGLVVGGMEGRIGFFGVLGEFLRRFRGSWVVLCGL